MKRRLDRVGFLRVRRWRIYSEIGLAKEAVEVWLEPQHVTITYADHHLRSYPATIDQDGWIRTMEDGTRYEHPFGSRQLMLWDVIEDDWGKTQYVGSTPRRKSTIPLAEQLRFALG
ncbi:hypothetical protein [Herpetosiphon geysericola]|uniref:hypothetical protein n=1 Tax=Herpetosiphon geysericola TaxID=70996 RepID=UPI00191C5661|nr:hypothetical protein [Herpetosiphon geysericola]